jgi:predicted dehydrogenase
MYIEVDGTEGSLFWRQENPNELVVRRNGRPHQIYTRDPGGGYLYPAANASCRLPSGHPEGYFEAFANIYASAFEAIIAAESGKRFEAKNTTYPNVYDGVEGMMFIQQCVASSSANGAWLPMTHPRIR